MLKLFQGKQVTSCSSKLRIIECHKLTWLCGIFFYIHAYNSKVNALFEYFFLHFNIITLDEVSENTVQNNLLMGTDAVTAISWDFKRIWTLRRVQLYKITLNFSLKPLHLYGATRQRYDKRWYPFWGLVLYGMLKWWTYQKQSSLVVRTTGRATQFSCGLKEGVCEYATVKLLIPKLYR